VHLFNGAGNRDHRALGTKYILKDRGADPNYEVISTHFLKANTTIPVPTVAQEWTEESRHFTVVKRVPGVLLEKIWSSMPQSAREELARCTAEYLGQLRSFQSETVGSVDGSPLYCGFLFPGKGDEGCQVPHAAEDGRGALEGIGEVFGYEWLGCSTGRESAAPGSYV
jgi:hypothetical protein